MYKKETKIIGKIGQISLIGLLFFVAILVMPTGGFATDYTSTSFTVTNPVIDSGTSSGSSANFGLGQSVSQTAIGKSTSTNFQLWSGFQYYFKVNANVLAATPGSAQVSLSWTVPQTFLGIGIASYEVGVGTVSGSYVFTDRGNVTSYVQTGLTNGTPYFFRIKAKSASGLFLVFSNEATATPVAATPPPPPPGPTPSPVPSPVPPPNPPPPPGNGAIILSGLAYPGRTVTILRDGVIVANTIADPGAQFNVRLGNLGAATYAISLYATDENNRRSPPLSFSQTLSDGVTITVNNLFLGPTIGLSHTEIKKGDTLSIFGYTAPSSDVTLTVHSTDEFVEKIKAGLNGAYFKAFNTAVLELGDHTGKTQSEKSSLISPESEAAAFKVGNTSVEIPTDNCKRSDLNCDTKVNLTDFSILLFYWNQTKPSNARADINKSGVVDLTDFSIMLYDWTG
jgi:hypothetical protein